VSDHDDLDNRAGDDDDGVTDIDHHDHDHDHGAHDDDIHDHGTHDHDHDQASGGRVRGRATRRTGRHGDATRRGCLGPSSHGRSGHRRR
jgi:hypothetical protein